MVHITSAVRIKRSLTFFTTQVRGVSWLFYPSTRWAWLLNKWRWIVVQVSALRASSGLRDKPCLWRTVMSTLRSPPRWPLSTQRARHAISCYQMLRKRTPPTTRVQTRTSCNPAPGRRIWQYWVGYDHYFANEKPLKLFAISEYTNSPHVLALSPRQYCFTLNLNVPLWLIMFTLLCLHILLSVFRPLDMAHVSHSIFIFTSVTHYNLICLCHCLWINHRRLTLYGRLYTGIVKHPLIFTHSFHTLS